MKKTNKQIFYGVLKLFSKRKNRTKELFDKLKDLRNKPHCLANKRFKQQTLLLKFFFFFSFYCFIFKCFFVVFHFFFPLILLLLIQHLNGFGDKKMTQ